MESIGRDGKQVRVEQERDRLLDVFQRRTGSRLNREIGLSRRECGQPLRLPLMTAHDQPTSAVNGQCPHRNGHPPALDRADSTAVAGHEDGDRHSDNVGARPTPAVSRR